MTLGPRVQKSYISTSVDCNLDSNIVERLYLSNQSNRHYPRVLKLESDFLNLCIAATSVLGIGWSRQAFQTTSCLIPKLLIQKSNLFNPPLTSKHFSFNMRFGRGIAFCLFSSAATVLAASSWTFDDASLTIHGKGSGVGGGGMKEKYVVYAKLNNTVLMKYIKAITGLSIDQQFDCPRGRGHT